ncbi:MAG: ribosome biogenesis GTPase Der [Armatimonadetes bacterium]|nr:ribosome biogenesis GTPase Der [Armatimonadota bacterium]
MSTPIVAIVGRTNVGKSTLFNRLVGRQIAVVDDYPGVTRDRLYTEMRLGGRDIVLVDTGGLVGAESDELIAQVKDQAAAALQEADVLIMLCDGLEGITALDHEVAEVARRTGKPVVLAVNKLENTTEGLEDFYALRLGRPHRISARTSYGLQGLTEALVKLLPPESEPEPRIAGETRIAIVGRPNVGKSAIVNSLLGEERVIVSDLPGTTRDAVDIAVEYNGRPFRLIDTAGLRRKSLRASGTEYYSSLRTLRALQRADVGVVVLDAAEGMTRQDARIAGEVEQAGRGTIIVVNKWDLVQDAAERSRRLAVEDQLARPLTKGQARRAEKTRRGDMERLVRAQIQFLDYAPVLFTSALTGEGLDELLSVAADIAEQFNRRVETAAVNRAVSEALFRHQPPGRGSRDFKVYYAAQVSTGPPTFVLKVNDPNLCHFSYERYLRNQLREEFGLHGVPIRLRIEKRSRRGDET